MQTMHLYNKFIEICNSLLQYVTTQYLVYGALISLAFFLVWTVIATLSSSIRKFYRRCHKLEKYLMRNKVGYENINSIDRLSGRISRGFFYGWNKFKRSSGRKPSDYLSKRDVLDAEVSDGLLNHGKTLMKTYVGITTALLFILNLAHLGKDAAFTFNILVEAMFLPFVYYVIMMLMYFVSNLIKQEIYIIATAHFYALVDSLDRCFDSNDYLEYHQLHNDDFKVVEKTEPALNEKQTETTEQEDVVEVKELETKEPEEIEEQKETFEEQSEVEESNQIEEDKNEETDIKEEFENQETVSDDSVSLENLINEMLGDDEIIEDDSESIDESETEIIEENEQLEEIENANANNEPEESQIEAENLEENAEVIEEIAPRERNWEAEDNLEYFDVFKKKNIDVEKYINEVPKEEEYASPFIDVDIEHMPYSNEPEETIQENLEEIDDLEIDNDENQEVIFENEAQEIVDEPESEDEIETELDEELIDNDDEEFLSEEASIFDEPILEENTNNVIEDVSEIESQTENYQFEDDENISSKEESEDFDFFEDNQINNSSEIDIFADENAQTENDLKSQIAQNLSASTSEIDSKLEDNAESVDLSALVGEFKQNYHKNETVEEDVDVQEKTNEAVEDSESEDFDKKEIFDKINDLESLINSAIGKVDAKNETKTSNKTRKTRKGKTKMTSENEATKKTRGRPKMQVIDENLKINNEAEFEEILARAEKLMRKSEEGLSASQSKRIEKELKIMMDAMNKYKEGEK